MTDQTMDVQDLIEKSADADFLRDMIGFAADRLMALEIDHLCGAGLKRTQSGSPEPA